MLDEELKSIYNRTLTHFNEKKMKLSHSFNPAYRTISVQPNCDLSWAKEGSGYCVGAGSGD